MSDMEGYEKVGKFRVKNSFLRFLEEFLPQGYYVELYNFLEATDEDLKRGDLEELQKEIQRYLKAKNIEASIKEGWLYAE